MAAEVGCAPRAPPLTSALSADDAAALRRSAPQQEHALAGFGALLSSFQPQSLALSVVAAASRLRYRGVPSDAQVDDALAILRAAGGFSIAFPVLMQQRGEGEAQTLLLCKGACRVLAAVRHVAATPGCAAAWLNVPVVFFREEVPTETLVRCAISRGRNARAALLRRCAAARG